MEKISAWFSQRRRAQISTMQGRATKKYAKLKCKAKPAIVPGPRFPFFPFPNFFEFFSFSVGLHFYKRPSMSPTWPNFTQLMQISGDGINQKKCTTIRENLVDIEMGWSTIRCSASLRDWCCIGLSYLIDLIYFHFKELYIF